MLNQNLSHSNAVDQLKSVEMRNLVATVLILSGSLGVGCTAWLMGFFAGVFEKAMNIFTAQASMAWFLGPGSFLIVYKNFDWPLLVFLWNYMKNCSQKCCCQKNGLDNYRGST